MRTNVVTDLQSANDTAPTKISCVSVWVECTKEKTNLNETHHQMMSFRTWIPKLVLNFHCSFHNGLFLFLLFKKIKYSLQLFCFQTKQHESLFLRLRFYNFDFIFVDLKSTEKNPLVFVQRWQHKNHRIVYFSFPLEERLVWLVHKSNLMSTNEMKIFAVTYNTHTHHSLIQRYALLHVPFVRCVCLTFQASACTFDSLSQWLRDDVDTFHSSCNCQINMRHWKHFSDTISIAVISNTRHSYHFNSLFGENVQLRINLIKKYFLAITLKY